MCIAAAGRLGKGSDVSKREWMACAMQLEQLCTILSASGSDASENAEKGVVEQYCR